MSKPYIPNDRLAKKARSENFRARSVYKLEELDFKFHLINKDLCVLDLAAAPGSWLQYTSKKVGEKGKILGLDLQPIDFVAPNVITEICDITNTLEVENLLEKFNFQQVDLILSDAAPSTTGIAELDHGKSIELNQAIFEISKKHLKQKGKLVMKVFDGRYFNDFIKKLKARFKEVKIFKSHASRERSKEVYVICK